MTGAQHALAALTLTAPPKPTPRERRREGSLHAGSAREGREGDTTAFGGEDRFRQKNICARRMTFVIDVPMWFSPRKRGRQRQGCLVSTRSRGPAVRKPHRAWPPDQQIAVHGPGCGEHGHPLPISTLEVKRARDARLLLSQNLERTSRCGRLAAGAPAGPQNQTASLSASRARSRFLRSLGSSQRFLSRIDLGVISTSSSSWM